MRQPCVRAFVATAVLLWASPSFAADPVTPTIAVVNAEPDKVGVDLTIEVSNPNAFAVDLVFVDCLAMAPEKMFTYGPAWVLFKDIAPGGKSAKKVDLLISDFSIISANPDMKVFPEPTETKCQVREFQTPVGHVPEFKYSVPKLEAPAR